MTMLIVGECAADHRYDLVDPTAASELEFENHVAKALMCYRPDFLCTPFHGTFSFDGRSYRPDLALVARDASHWFVVEVELASHSLHGHVIPQVRAFKYGEPQVDCIASLVRGLHIDDGQAKQLLQNVPRSVVVVVNKQLSDWQQVLRAVEVGMLSVSVYKAHSTGILAYEVDGVLAMPVSSIGFGAYSAVDCAIVFPRTVKLPDGPIHIVDEADGVGLWKVKHSSTRTWVAKCTGNPGYPDGQRVQLLRTIEGLISMRRSQAV